MGRLAKTALLGGGVALAGWIAWGLYSGRTTEKVPYEVRRTVNGVEVREYPETVLAETTAPDQITAFRRLSGYISGGNDGETSVAMTAPVETGGGASVAMTAPVRSEAVNGEVRMAFYLPASYDAETAPEPTDPAVALDTEPARTVAAKRFSWYATSRRANRQERRLLAVLEREGIEPSGDPYLLQYDDPGTPPFMRRNE
ncbi:MAG: heme-binding protein, partial [Halobacteriales archaeon]